MNAKLYETINNPEKWSSRMGQPCAAATLQRFQLGLDSIFGTGMARIVWGQDWERTKTWNRYGEFWYPTYLSHINSDVEYIAKPRYYVEGRISLEITRAQGSIEQGQESIKVKDEAGREQLLTTDTFTEAALAQDGQWEELICIDRHDNVCCAWNQQRGYECAGYYRHPDNRDLQYLAARVFEMFQHFKGDPRLVRSDEEKNAFLRRRLEHLTEAKRQRKAQLSGALREFFSSHFAKLDQSPTEQAHGPYHFLNQNTYTQGAKTA